MNKPYITCRELIDSLDSYVDGSMPANARAEVDRHLAVCPACQNYLNNYRQTIAMGKSVFHDADAPVPDDVPEDLMKAILSTLKKA